MKAYTCYYDEKMIRISKRRQNEDADSFRNEYRYRAGIEASISQYDCLTGVKHLRVRVLKAISFADTLKALGLNILKSARFSNLIKKWLLQHKKGWSSHNSCLH